MGICVQNDARTGMSDSVTRVEAQIFINYFVDFHVNVKFHLISFFLLEHIYRRCLVIM